MWYRDDSCVRALCCATGKDWTTIFNDLTKISDNFHDMPHSKNVIHEYCESHNFEHITFGKPAIGEKRPTIEQFIENNKIGTYILYTRDYYLCVKDGVLYNTSEMKLIGVLYMKKLLIMTIQSALLVTSKRR